MFNQLPEKLVRDMTEAALECREAPFSEDRTTTLCCSPMVTYNWSTGKRLARLMEETHIEHPTHEEIIDGLLYLEADVWRDSRGNFWFKL